MKTERAIDRIKVGIVGIAMTICGAVFIVIIAIALFGIMGYEKLTGRKVLPDCEPPSMDY